MDRIVSFCIAIFAAYWAYMGWFVYGFWEDGIPGAGFLPFLGGVLTFALAIVGLFKTDRPVFHVEKKNFIPVIGALVMIFAIQFLGMIVSAGLFIIIWLLWVEKFTVKKAAAIGVGTTLVIYVLFSAVLEIPFPQGLLGI